MGNHYTPHYTYQYPPQPYHSQPPTVTFYHPHEPHPHPHPRHKPKGLGSNGCLRCICCCYNCLLFVIVASFVISIFFLLHYQPEKPIYELKDFAVKRFDIRDMNLETEIAISVLAHNTNSKIELSYGDDNSIGVSYSGTKFCSGSFPPFEQPTKNTTIVVSVYVAHTKRH
ncbi:hypothetical protein V6N13_107842 [Hibiscus sabdariffa]|uniref:Late embryogenesis abundant protein LEA-2 subgroup domain-containing protein n=1 Tax=Hibiscus sabdariffa TaxID=183260 RepID=A0ABR2SQM3_9ROSI